MAAFILNVTFDAIDPARLAQFWSQVTGYDVVTADHDFAALHAPDERGVRNILFYPVEQPTQGKNRMHVDLAAREPIAEIARLIELGASLIDGGSADAPRWREGNDTRWVVMADPEGNEFCLG